MAFVRSKPGTDARPLLIGGLMLGTLALAVIAGSGRLPGGTFGVPLLLLALIFVLVSAGRLELGVALIPAVATAVPFSIGTGTQSQLVAGLLYTGLLMGLWAVRAILSRDFRYVPSPVNAACVALSVVWILSYIDSNAVRPPLIRIWSTFPMAQLGGLMVVLVSVGALMLSLNAGRDVRWIKLATWSLIGLGTLGILAYYLHATRLVWFMSINGLFQMWVVALAYGQALFNDELPRWARGGLVLLVFAWLVKAAILDTFWFSGWGPPLVVVAVVTLFRSRPAFVAMLGALLASLPFTWHRIYDSVWGLTVNKGDLSRLDIWHQQFQLIQQFPLLGTGPAGYAVFNMTLFADSMYSMSTHENYLDVIDETGIVGSLIFLWFLITVLVVGWQACRRYMAASLVCSWQ
jgi:hypothetical protein